jgi:hypothetical protein
MAPQERSRRRRSPTKKVKQQTRSRPEPTPADDALASAPASVETDQGQGAEAAASEQGDVALGPSVLDVRLLREGRPDVAALSVGLDENLAVRVRFVLRGADAHGLAAEESRFEVRVYAEDVTSGARSDVASHTAKLVDGSQEYEVEMQASALPTGLYRLVTVVALEAPVKAIEYHQGPVVNVTAAESSLTSAEPVEAPSSR